MVILGRCHCYVGAPHTVATKAGKQLPPEQPFPAPRSQPRCPPLPRAPQRRWHSVAQGWPHSQHTEAVDSRDALAVPQQVAAIGARRQQQLLPSLTGDACMVDGQRVHVGAVSHCGQLSLCTALPPTAPQPCAPLSISVSVADVNRMCSHLWSLRTGRDSAEGRVRNEHSSFVGFFLCPFLFSCFAGYNILAASQLVGRGVISLPTLTHAAPRSAGTWHDEVHDGRGADGHPGRMSAAAARRLSPLALTQGETKKGEAWSQRPSAKQGLFFNLLLLKSPGVRD